MRYLGNPPLINMFIYDTVTEKIYYITFRNLGVASGSFFFFLSSRGGHGIRKILMDFHPYGYETSIFTLVAPHEVG